MRLPLANALRFLQMLAETVRTFQAQVGHGPPRCGPPYESRLW